MSAKGQDGASQKQLHFINNDTEVPLMLRSVNLEDYMLDYPVRVKADADIFEAVHQILVHKISGLCVVDEHDNLVGVLSELDCLRAILSATYNEVAVGKVKDYMATDVVTAGRHEDIIDVASDMLKRKHRRRPVVENGKLVGQITCRQILRAVKEFRAPKDVTEY